MIHGLTNANLGIPDYAKALHQHEVYVQALIDCGLRVTELELDEKYPDSTFVEDSALLTPRCAIIMNPGAISRRGEIINMKREIKNFFTDIEEVHSPGTVEGGDIMMVGNHHYIGLSDRTNIDGAEQVIHLLQTYGLTASVVDLKNVLHLKTGLAYLENNQLVATGEFLSNPVCKRFNIIEISDDEAYAANCIWINDKVLVPQGYPGAMQKIEEMGYTIIEVDVSEFRKLDGGLSCLSLRF